MLNGKIGFIDKSGKIIAKPEFDDVGVFSEGLAKVKLNGKWGFIDKSGKIIVRPEFDDVDDFREGLA
ncbi:WG repeat-containing protein, partial [Campylobacter coli]|uniref:WG repeat-containing protein n=1 Tax=Campylobacter coli TaxID=195 RepID=UPI00351CC250